jgi:hypothetical protein
MRFCKSIQEGEYIQRGSTAATRLAYLPRLILERMLGCMGLAVMAVRGSRYQRLESNQGGCGIGGLSKVGILVWIVRVMQLVSSESAWMITGRELDM